MEEESEKSVRIGEAVEDFFVVLVLSGLATGLVFLFGVILVNLVLASSFVLFFSLACCGLFLSDKLGRLEKRLSAMEDAIRKKAG